MKKQFKVKMLKRIIELFGYDVTLGGKGFRLPQNKRYFIVTSKNGRN